MSYSSVWPPLPRDSVQKSTKALILSFLLVFTFLLLPSSVIEALPLSPSSVTDSLVAHWAMEEGSGTTLIDSSSYGNLGFTVGGPIWQGGPSGLSIVFNGFTQSAWAPSAPCFNVANALTIAAWIQPRWRFQQRVVGKGVWTGILQGYELFLSSVSPYRVCFRINNAGLYSNSTYPIDGSWMHVAATWDGSLMKMYINGVLQTVTGNSSPPATVPHNVMIGGASYGSTSGNLYNGGLDEVRIYRRALTADEVAILAGTATRHTISASAGSNGSISPSGEVAVYHGENQTFTIAADPNYHIDDVLVDGLSVGAVESHDFVSVTENHTISATFAVDQYAITASAGDNGTVEPMGVTMVDYGNNQTYTITPSVGYHVTDVLVDDVSVGPVEAYTFIGVNASHTISATFAINTYTITASAGANGSISPSGITTLNYGDDQIYAIIPNTGYHVADVLVDDVSIGVVTNYVFSDVNADHTISASFAINTYTITATAGANGSISPSGITTLNYGDNQTYSINPSSGFHVADVVVDDVSVGAVAEYTFMAVDTDHTIFATFALTMSLPEITSTPVVLGRIGELYSYDVEATGIPEPTFDVAVTPPPQHEMTIGLTDGVIEWTPASIDTGYFSVIVTATNEAGTDTQGFSIYVTCCTGTTANVNMSGIVDGGDLALLVAYLTNAPGMKPTLPCIPEANVNGSGIIDGGDLALLVAYLTNVPGQKPTLPNCP